MSLTYYQGHRDARLAYAKRYYADHRDQVLMRSRDVWQQVKADPIRWARQHEYDRQYKKKWNAEHPERYRETSRKQWPRIKANPTRLAKYRVRVRRSAAKWRAARNGAWAKQQEDIRKWSKQHQDRRNEQQNQRNRRLKNAGVHYVGRSLLDLSSVDWESALKVDSKAIAVTSDYHVPFVDPAWLERLVCEARKRHVTELAVIGDFWDLDSISIYAANGKKFGLDEEIIEINKVLRYLEQQFKHFYFSIGNHEYRWARLHTAFNTNQLWKLCDLPENTVTTRNDYMILNENWRLVHPKNYRQQGGSVAQAIAMKHKMNIVNTHGHFAWGPELDTMSKSYWLMDLGGLFDPKKIEYMQRSSTFPMLNRGFGFIIDGEPELIKEHLT